MTEIIELFPGIEVEFTEPERKPRERDARRSPRRRPRTSPRRHAPRWHVPPRLVERIARVDRVRWQVMSAASFLVVGLASRSGAVLVAWAFVLSLATMLRLNARSGRPSTEQRGTSAEGRG